MTPTPFRRLSAATCLALLISSSVLGAERSQSVRAEFVRKNVCPSTGKNYGRCPGWQVDHMESLCAGGKDEVSNLQWLSIEQHRLKTKIDVLRCSVLRRSQATQ